MKLEYIQMSNGKFAICPKCNRIMAMRMGGRGIIWSCIMGCGYEIKEGRETK